MNSKNRNVIIFVGCIYIALVMLFVGGCKQADTVVSSTSSSGTGGNTQGSTKSVVSGLVINTVTGIPIDSALIQIIGSSINVSLLTNLKGIFSDTIETPSNINLVIYVSKSGFTTDTINVNVTAGVNFAIPAINLTASNSTGTKPSGNPVSIYLYSQTATGIGVQGSGSLATATITFVAVDSSGTPIDLDHSVNVGFSFGANPGGGAVLSPDTVSTNESGLASVNVTSGTIAGVVQIYAALFSKGVKIYSKPVAISIFGGLPDPIHFSVAPEQLNFPGYNIYGLTDVINAYVGDKYGNPARPGTSVYFTSTGGIIGGSSVTNPAGIGSVSLLSAAPQPVHPTLGPGFATITASTADENLNTINTNTLVLFSGFPTISVTPSTIDIPFDSSEIFNYTVCDQNQNPLASGENISVTLTAPNIAAQGDVAVTLPDTQSRFWTHFSFTVYDTSYTGNVQKPVIITILVTGPNGATKESISGYYH
jgi:hypothetical protein